MNSIWFLLPFLNVARIIFYWMSFFYANNDMFDLKSALYSF